VLAVTAAMAASHRAELHPAREYGVFWNLSRRTAMRGMAEPMFDGSPAREDSSVEMPRWSCSKAVPSTDDKADVSNGKF